MGDGAALDARAGMKQRVMPMTIEVSTVSNSNLAFWSLLLKRSVNMGFFPRHNPHRMNGCGAQGPFMFTVFQAKLKPT